MCKDVRHAIYNAAELENAFDGFAAEAGSGVIVAQAPPQPLATIGN
jgi:hypothetical protein